MEKRKSFTIPRKEWLRGEPERSMLYNPCMEKLCCLGHYGLFCGVPKQNMHYLGVLANVMITAHTAAFLEKLVVVDGNTISHKPVTTALMKINDSLDISEEDREQRIKDQFREHLNVDVIFVD